MSYMLSLMGKPSHNSTPVLLFPCGMDSKYSVWVVVCHLVYAHCCHYVLYTKLWCILLYAFHIMATL